MPAKDSRRPKEWASGRKSRCVALRDAQRVLRRGQHRHVIVVGLDDALGWPRRARGVDDGGDVLRAPAGHAGGQLALELVLVVPAEPPQSLPGEDPGLLALIALDHHDLLEAGHVPPYLDDLGEL